MFNIGCTALNMTLSVNDTCRLSQFPFLQDDFKGLFAWGTPLTGADTDDIYNIIGNLNETYSFYNRKCYLLTECLKTNIFKTICACEF